VQVSSCFGGKFVYCLLLVLKAAIQLLIVLKFEIQMLLIGIILMDPLKLKIESNYPLDYKFHILWQETK
jgi:hypothetical protein